MAFSSEYGWIRIMMITNNTNKTVRFKNPHNNDKSGEIKAGEKDEFDCIGCIPYYSSGKRYEISYVNENLGKRVNIQIKDLGGNWEASFAHNGTVEDDRMVEDVRRLEPTPGYVAFGAHIRVNNDGYEIIEYHLKRTRARIIYGSA